MSVIGDQPLRPPSEDLGHGTQGSHKRGGARVCRAIEDGTISRLHSTDAARMTGVSVAFVLSGHGALGALVPLGAAAVGQSRRDDWKGSSQTARPGKAELSADGTASIQCRTSYGRREQPAEC